MILRVRTTPYLLRPSDSIQAPVDLLGFPGTADSRRFSFRLSRQELGLDRFHCMELPRRPVRRCEPRLSDNACNLGKRYHLISLLLSLIRH